MASRLCTALSVLVVLAVAGATFFRGLDWRLPSHEADRWLFGDRPVWTGAEIVEKLAARRYSSLAPVLGGEDRGEGVGTGAAQTRPSAARPNPLTLTLSPEYGGEGTRGADVDADPILDRSQPVVLNDTDAKRAAIVQRYRLMSGQPDEFIQFKALAEMSQRKGLARFDPRLYQYGGLWIYPVGALVRGGIATGYIEAPPAGVKAREFYLDRPEVFGKFYVLARAYSAAWGVIAALAVFLISRDATRSRSLIVGDHAKTGDAWRPGYLSDVLALLAAIAFVFLPSVQTSAHEAKPHLAGAALCLVAVIAASKFVQTGERRWLIAAGALCGAAMGMVVSMVLSLAILPAMIVVRGRRVRADLLGGGSPCRSAGTGGAAKASRSDALQCVAAIVTALAVYAITNPFVLLNAIRAPQLLRSNLGNSTAMYGVHGTFAVVNDVIRLAGHAMTPIGARIALAALFALTFFNLWHGLPARSFPRKKAEWAGSPCHRIVGLLLVPASLVALQFILLAAGKQAEYARFGLVAFAAACVGGAIALRAFVAAPKRFGLCLFPVLAISLLIPPMGGGRVFDAWKWDEGDQTALQLDTMRQIGNAHLPSPWRMGVAYEPAPWSSPPINLFDEDIILVRMTPQMLEHVDAVVWPINLENQLFEPSRDRESLDWREPRWGVRSEARDGQEDRWRGGW